MTTMSAPNPPLGRWVVASVWVLALLCLLYGMWPVWRAFFPLEIDLKEPWNAYHVSAVLNAGVLYPPSGGLISNNYPPLYYYLLAGLSRLGGDVIYIGRALSLLATLCLCVTIGLCIRRLNGSRIAALIGGLWFVGTMVRYADWYVGMNDPHIPALAISTLGLLWVLHADQKRAPEPGILLMVIGGFFKHSLFATPAASLYLLATHNKRVALRAALVGFGAAALGLALCAAVYGGNFIDQMFSYPRDLSLLRAGRHLERLGSVLPAMILCGIWMWHDRSNPAARFIMAFTGIAFVLYVVQKLADQIDVNAQFELNVALAIGIGLAFDRVMTLPITAKWGAQRGRLAIVWPLIAGLLLAPGLEPYLIVTSATYRALFHANTEIARSEVKRIASDPGEITCSLETVCYRAGKAFVYDDTYVGQALLTGRVSAEQLAKMTTAKGIRYDPVDARAGMIPLLRQFRYGRVHQ